MDIEGPAYGIDYLQEDHVLYQIVFDILNKTKGSSSYLLESYPNFAEEAKKYLLSKGYNNFVEYTRFNSLIDVHKIKVDGYTEHPLCEHCDDDGGVNGPVNTLVFYPKISSSIEGGRLLISHYTVDTKALNKITKYIYPIDTHSIDDKMCCVYMRGNVEHSIEHMNGTGIRCSVVIQLPCTRKIPV